MQGCPPELSPRANEAGIVIGKGAVQIGTAVLGATRIIVHQCIIVQEPIPLIWCLREGLQKQGLID